MFLKADILNIPQLISNLKDMLNKWVIPENLRSFIKKSFGISVNGWSLQLKVIPIEG